MTKTLDAIQAQDQIIYNLEGRTRHLCSALRTVGLHDAADRINDIFIAARDAAKAVSVAHSEELTSYFDASMAEMSNVLNAINITQRKTSGEPTP